MRKISCCLCVVVAILVFSCGSKPAAKNPFMVADRDPFSLDPVNVWLDKTFSSDLKETEVEVIFIPRQNEVSLKFRHDLLTYRQFWNEAARQQFIEAWNRYNEDFTNKNLVSDYRKSRAAYGKGTLRFEWEAFKYTTTFRATPQIELGYRFKDKAVYFTVFLRASKEQSSESGRNNDSPQYSVYFTRAQAEALAKLFDQAYLLELAGVSQDPDQDQDLPSVDAAGRDIYIP